MNRYYYYLIITSMMINTILFVPTALFEERYRGSVMSMLLAIPIGTLFCVICTKSFERFPQQGLPEILKSFFPRWLRWFLLAFFGVLWFIAGGIVLVTYARITKGFLNPDMHLTIILLAFMFFATWGATRQSTTVLYIMEILIALNLPFIFFILFKAVFSPYVNWDSIRAMGAYVWKPPTWKSLSASLYVFTGYVNIAIFNRVFGNQFKARYLWSVPILGGSVLLTSFFIPIGLHGMDGVDNYVFTWISTADSIRMEFGFIERILFLFLLLYLNLSLIFGIITWHVGTELIRSILPEPRRPKLQSLLPWLICGCFAAVFLVSGYNLDEKQLIAVSKYWLVGRMPAEVLLVGLIIFLARKVKRA